MSEYLLDVRHLTKKFPLERGIFGRARGHIHAVDNVSFRIRKGETLGLVGESGCGKTTLGRCLLRLIEPTTGHIFFKGEDITAYGKKKMQAMRKKMQIIFQDPYASLNPRMTIESTLSGPLDIHRLATSPRERARRIHELLDQVQLSRDVLSRYPHEFSGGQRQRICIARALAVGPEFIVCDESVSALDVSVQAQIINLLMDLQDNLGHTYLFITHDLRVVEYISDRVAVMYLGRIVESAPVLEFHQNPKHPYTAVLHGASPSPSPCKGIVRKFPRGDIPSPIDPPSGCHFHPRCSFATDRCRQSYPNISRFGKESEYRCFHPL